jgi:hypothetical protein
MSAPYCFITSCGAVTLPSDFDIFGPARPDEAVRQHRLVGRAPRVPQDSSSEEWNQPRCWSEPSRYRSRPATCRSARLQHEGVGRAGIEPHLDDVHHLLVVVRVAVVAEEARGIGLEPGVGALCSKASTTRSTTRGRAAARRSACRRRPAIGTPQARWREMHQSGRCSIIERRRLRPASGTKRVASSGRSAFARRPLVSIEMNHCGVLRKISGAFERQECG